MKQKPFFQRLRVQSFAVAVILSVVFFAVLYLIYRLNPDVHSRYICFYWASDQYIDIYVSNSFGRLLILGFLAGVLGSLLHVASSFLKDIKILTHLAQDRDIENPNGIKKLRITYYLLRLFIGGGVGTFFVLALKSKMLLGMEPTENNGYFYMAMAGLGGLFSNKSIIKMNELFRKWLRVREPEEEQKSNGQASPASHLPVVESELEKAIEDFISIHSDDWLSRYPELNSVSLGRKEVNGFPINSFAIVFEFEKKLPLEKADAIPKFYEIYFNGKKKLVPTDITEGEISVAHAYVVGKRILDGKGFNPVHPGIGVSLKSTPKNIGTIGFKAYQDNIETREFYLISCFHVLCNRLIESQDDLRLNSNDAIYNQEVMLSSNSTSSGKAIGNLIDARLNKTLDVALVKINQMDGLSIDEQVYLVPDSPNGKRAIKSHDLGICQVTMVGRSSNKQQGIIVANKVVSRIKYAGISRKLEGLIKTTKISVEGDSGAPVLDESNRLIGIVVSSNSHSSYILPIDRALDAFLPEIQLQLA